MATVRPIAKDRAPEELQPIFEDFGKRLGRVPNIFATMAHRPEALKTFLPFYSAVTQKGTVEPRLKELAYLKVSLVNGCEY
ncbi:MAG TPA: carboxymuconolactone decarboxylase family protein [Calidithermus sp.]|nr:carboxymuconolactone decarboxylase family protein [Calidithermus sp.]